MTRPPARRPWVAALAGLALLAGASCARVPRAEADDDYGPVGEFALTERNGERVTRRDLLGKVWVASFQFTRCTGPCPQISRTMKRLQDELADRPDLLLVTFTVDPEHDDPDELRRFADLQGADPRRWLFLTGKPSEIYALLRNGFQVFAQPNTGAERRPGSEVAHDTHLVVVDRRGHVRGYFEGLPDPRLPDSDEEFEANLRRLRAKVDSLVYEPAPYLPRDLPRLNATLNALAAGLLLAGFAAVRARFLRLHAALMLTALGVSAVFLASYLYYHIGVRGGRPTRFAEQAAGAPAWVAYVYMAVLLTHTALAAVAAPLAVYTAYQGLRGRIERHRRVARWALPVWLYVSVTGVVVYWMLYRLYPPT